MARNENVNIDNEIERAIDTLYDTIRLRIGVLRRDMAIQAQYIGELEQLLPPGVIVEIRARYPTLALAP